MIISRWILLRVRNVSDKSYRENQNTHFMFNNYFFPESCALLWHNVEKYGGARGATDDVTIWRIRVACWVAKACWLVAVIFLSKLSLIEHRTFTCSFISPHQMCNWAKHGLLDSVGNTTCCSLNMDHVHAFTSSASCFSIHEFSVKRWTYRRKCKDNVIDPDLV